MPTLDRRAFVAASAASAAALAVPASRPARAAATMIERMDGGLPPGFPAQDAADVRTVVGKSHVDYDTVRAMVTKRPALAKSAWDWGFGDWESALGAASHMGRRDIVEVLMAHGARPNLYTYAMLGQVDVVRAICEANPGIQRVNGPHGITLLQHARHGKEPAASVVAYLEELGDADIGQPSLPVAEADAIAFYVGDYAPEGVTDTVLRVAWNERRKGLTLARDEQVSRFLSRTAPHVFAPNGAAAVRVTFEIEGPTAAAVTIVDGDLLVRAARVR